MRRLILASFAAFLLVCGCQLDFSTVGSWTRETSPPAAITSNHVISLKDGRVAVFGAFLPGGQWSSATTVYDPGSHTWTKAAPMPGTSTYPDVVAMLQDGSVLVEGGSPLQGATWIYDPRSDSWSQAGSLIQPRVGPSFTVLSDGRLLIVGGFEPANQTPQTPTGQGGFTAIATAEIYDPATRKWSAAGRLESPREGIALAALGGGGAIVAGGCQGAAGFTPPDATSEVFDPATNTWARTTPMPTAVCVADGIGLRDGRALILDEYEFFGGARPLYNPTDTAYVYDPRTRTWAVSGALAGGGAMALVLSDGRVFVPELRDGAQQGRVFSEMVGGQVFDPASNQWSYASTTSVTLPISYMFSSGAQVAVPLPNGDAIVILKTVALAFHPRVAPASTELLDSSGLTLALLGVAGAVALLIVLAFVRAARTGSNKLQ